MVPNTNGVWKWRRNDGKTWDLPVFNVGVAGTKWFRTYFLGGYYDVEDLSKNGHWMYRINANPYGPVTEQISGWVHPSEKHTIA